MLLHWARKGNRSAQAWQCRGTSSLNTECPAEVLLHMIGQFKANLSYDVVHRWKVEGTLWASYSGAATTVRSSFLCVFALLKAKSNYAGEVYGLNDVCL